MSAADHSSWKIKWPPTRPFVTLPRTARKPSGELELHWGDLAGREIHRQATGRTRTVVDCARAYAFDALRVAELATGKRADPFESCLAVLLMQVRGARRGLAVVRFTWDEVMFQPDYVLEAMEDVVGLAHRAGSWAS